MVQKVSQRTLLERRLKKAHKSSDDEIRAKMDEIVLKVSENAKRRKSMSKTLTFQRLWSEHAALEYIAINDREDVPVEDALQFYDDAMKNISALLQVGLATPSSMRVLDSL